MGLCGSSAYEEHKDASAEEAERMKDEKATEAKIKEEEQKHAHEVCVECVCV